MAGFICLPASDASQMCPMQQKEDGDLQRLRFFPVLGQTLPRQSRRLQEISENHSLFREEQENDSEECTQRNRPTLRKNRAEETRTKRAKKTVQSISSPLNPFLWIRLRKREKSRCEKRPDETSNILVALLIGGLALSSDHVTEKCYVIRLGRNTRVQSPRVGEKKAQRLKTRCFLFSRDFSFGVSNDKQYIP